MSQMWTIELPYPPSVNSYWKSWRGRVVLSERAKSYKLIVMALACVGEPFTAPETKGKNVSLKIAVYPPDKRRRDLDNVCKAILDSLIGVAYHDDSQVKHLECSMKEYTPGGKVVVSVEVIGG